jgi:predicted AAA+ superfamily ATPase
VIECEERQIWGIEVKASATVSAGDLRRLNRLRDATGDKFRCGIVLYDGETALPFGEQMFAVPVAELWAVRK